MSEMCVGTKQFRARGRYGQFHRRFRISSLRTAAEVNLTTFASSVNEPLEVTWGLTGVITHSYGWLDTGDQILMTVSWSRQCHILKLPSTCVQFTVLDRLSYSAFKKHIWWYFADIALPQTPLLLSGSSQVALNPVSVEQLDFLVWRDKFFREHFQNAKHASNLLKKFCPSPFTSNPRLCLCPEKPGRARASCRASCLGRRHNHVPFSSFYIQSYGCYF